MDVRKNLKAVTTDMSLEYSCRKTKLLGSVEARRFKFEVQR